jgi:[ribosomal protein S5]-alanine N-acetyltransferase
MQHKPHIPYIETDRLMLTVPTSDDARRMLHYVTMNREHLAAWEPLKPDEYFTEQFWVDRLSFEVEEFNAGRSLVLVLLDRTNPEGPFIGRVHFSNITYGVFQAAHLGYSLDDRSTGKGLMREALTAAIKYVFEELNLHRVMANHVPENIKSAKLLERLGFTVEGYARDYIRIAGDWKDHVLTSLVNDSWKPDELKQPRILK